MNQRSTPLPVLLAFLLTAACGGQEAAEQPQETEPAAEPVSSSPAEPLPTTVDRVALSEPSSMAETAPQLFTVDFITTAGEFSVECHRDWSPQGADRFYNLVKRGFFHDVRFFRVVPGFMVQFGIHGDPGISQEWKSARIQDDPVVESNLPGYMTFATSGKNSRTTQVFINYGNNAGLDGQGFSPFGKVVSGMDSVTGIYSVYREQASQGRIQDSGNSYLQTQFPEMDYVLSTVLR